ncbi:hypothetical protein [Synechococcus sp. MIT S9504]|nr:hypothetical protein [Synechococcus sp. MIT S9504]
MTALNIRANLKDLVHFTAFGSVSAAETELWRKVTQGLGFDCF